MNSKKRNQKQSDLGYEQCESRNLLATFVVSGTTLVVTGSSGDDVVAINQNPGNAYVHVATEADGVPIQSQFLLASSFDKVEANLGDGDDEIRVNTWKTTEINGGAGDDLLIGSYYGDVIHGDAGADKIYGRHNREAIGELDKLFGDDGEDLIYGGAGSNEIHGGAGNDTVYPGLVQVVPGGDLYVNTVFGDGGDDNLYGSYGREITEGGAGNDTLRGNNNVDTLRGGDGDDYVNGDNGDDFVYGDAGIDNLHGGADHDEVYGGDDKDYVYGEGGNDVLYGDGGDDLIYDGYGDDNSYGGDGNDEFFTPTDAPHSDFASNYEGGAGNDIFHIAELAGNYYGQAGDDVFNVLGSLNNVSSGLSLFGDDDGGPHGNDTYEFFHSSTDSTISGVTPNIYIQNSFGIDLVDFSDAGNAPGIIAVDNSHFSVPRVDYAKDVGSGHVIRVNLPETLSSPGFGDLKHNY